MISGGYTGVFAVLYDFQTLLSGIAAILAALYGGRALFNSAKVPVESAKQEAKAAAHRRRVALCAMLASEFKRLSALAVQAQATIVTTIAANVNVTPELKAGISIPVPPITSKPEEISSLDVDILGELFNVIRIIEQYNDDLNRAGGVFGDDNFKKWMTSQAKTLVGITSNISSKLEGLSRQSMEQYQEGSR